MPLFATIDIGTNSVLYSLVEARKRGRLNEIYFERHSPRIGKNLASKKSAVIDDDSFSALLKIMRRLVRHAKKHKANHVLIAGTNPFRKARNGKAIAEKLGNEIGQVVRILSPDDEARISFMGAVGTLRPDQSAGVIDLGGGSTEFVVYQGTRRKLSVSLPEGAVSLTERFKTESTVDTSRFGQFDKYLAAYKNGLQRIGTILPTKTLLVGGTSSALALIKFPDFIELNTPRPLTVSDINLSMRCLAPMTAAVRRKLLQADKKRAEIIFAGAYWLATVYKYTGLIKAEATPHGLRHGLVREFMDARL